MFYLTVTKLSALFFTCPLLKRERNIGLFTETEEVFFLPTVEHRTKMGVFLPTCSNSFALQ